MPPAADRSNSLADWTVLGLLVERPRHGFSLVKELGPDTLLGNVWSIPNPMVYRALRVLHAQGMILPADSESSSVGPRRTPMTPTDRGRRSFLDWAQQPVEHFRDARVALRLKLHLSIRVGLDPEPLLRAQRDIYQRLRTAFPAPTTTADDPSSTLLRLWREESSAATISFLDRAVAHLEQADPA